MKTKILALVACGALVAGSVASAEQIKPITKADGTISTQEFTGLGAMSEAQLIALFGSLAAAAAFFASQGGGGGSAPQTPVVPE